MNNALVWGFLIFGLLFSAYLAIEGGIFMGVVFALMSIGLAVTMHSLIRGVSYRIIFFVWLAIVVVVIGFYISTSVFEVGDVFRNPIKYL